MGRKSKINEELINKIAEYVEKGSFVKDACILVGIDEDTYYRWKQIGLEDRKAKQDTIYSDFLSRMEKSEVLQKQKHIDVFFKDDSKTWQKSAWWLERKFYDEFGRKDKLQHEGKDGGDIEIFVKITDDQSTEESI